MSPESFEKVKQRRDPSSLGDNNSEKVLESRAFLPSSFLANVKGANFRDGDVEEDVERKKVFFLPSPPPSSPPISKWN